MELEFHLRLLSGSGGNNSMSERSRDIARRVREKAEQKRLETEKSVTEVKVRKHGLTSTWNQLSTLLSQMCDELREENVDVDLVCSFHGDEIRVTRKGTAAQIRGTRSEVTHGMEFLGKLPNG